MKKTYIFSFVFFIFSYSGLSQELNDDDIINSIISEDYSEINKESFNTNNSADFILLDMVSSKKYEFSLDSQNNKKVINNIEINFKKCDKSKNKKYYTQNFAIIEILNKEEKIFSGWISKEFPHLNYLNIENYKLFLVDCRRI
jgi:hypothetical protein